MRRRVAALVAVATVCGVELLRAQAPAALTAERRAYLAWLEHAPTSPFAAIALQRIGEGITLGPPGSDLELEGLSPRQIMSSSGRITLDSAGVTRLLALGHVTSLGPYHLLVVGRPSRASLLVYGAVRNPVAPLYYAYARDGVDTVTLQPPSQRTAVLLLGPDGAELEAEEAGVVQVPRYGAAVSLRVRRFPGDTPDESELEIYFQDGTNGNGSYPAGRFVSLEPLGNARYRLDMNRARNPFCAYSSVFPCPAPWAGNSIAGSIHAGERYAEHAPRKAESPGH